MAGERRFSDLGPPPSGQVPDRRPVGLRRCDHRLRRARKPGGRSLSASSHASPGPQGRREPISGRDRPVDEIVGLVKFSRLRTSENRDPRPPEPRERERGDDYHSSPGHSQGRLQRQPAPRGEARGTRPPEPRDFVRKFSKSLRDRPVDEIFFHKSGIARVGFVRRRPGQKLRGEKKFSPGSLGPVGAAGDGFPGKTVFRLRAGRVTGGCWKRSQTMPSGPIYLPRP